MRWGGGLMRGRGGLMRGGRGIDERVAASQLMVRTIRKAAK